jgi:hypothetical protein
LSFTVDHLGRKIVERAAKRLTAIAWRMYAPAKVTDLEVAFDAKKKVLGLDIAVDHVLAMQIR